MRAFIQHRVGLAVLVLAAFAALYGLAYVTRPAPAPPKAAAPVKVPVESVETVCPDSANARLSALTPDPAKDGGTGSITIARLTEPGAPAPTSVSLKQAGVLWQADATKATGKPTGKAAKKQAGGPVTVAATGAMAAGLEAGQTTRTLTGASRGLAGVRCVQPGASAWFVGPGPAAADVTLYLANADRAAASVSITIYSGEGPIVGGAGSGLLLRPGERRAVALRDLAPSPLVMAVHVETDAGRVTAAAKAVLRDGKGADWLPLAAEPATTVVVPGVPGGGGLRTLYVATPGEADTLVRVKAVTEDGAYAMKGREAIEVAPGAAASMDITTGIGGRPAAIVLTSDVPIVAGMMINGTGTQQDVAFTAGTAPIDHGTIVADNRTGERTRSRLVLSAPGAAAKVRVRIIPSKGTAPSPVEVSLKAARTKEVKLAAPPGGGPYGVVVLPEPGSGPVYGGRVLDERTDDGLLLTVQPFAPARTEVTVPVTADTESAVLP